MRCDQLLYAPVLYSDRNRSFARPELLLEVKRRVESKIRKAKQPEHRALFVSRKDAPDRHLSNEDEVIEHLRTVFPHLRVVCLSGMTVADQAQLFHQANVIVGPHGQAFHNVLFCNNSLIIQLQAGERARYGLKDWCQTINDLGQLGDNDTVVLHSNTNPDRNDDWNFPIERLTTQLEAILHARSTMATIESSQRE